MMRLLRISTLSAMEKAGRLLRVATVLLVTVGIAGVCSAQTVRGVVDRVTVTDGDPRLHIGDQEIKLKNVKEVLPGAAT